MENIIFAVLVLGAIAIVFGLILSVAAKVFEVKVDERLPKIQECLAGANCGGCGYPGCAGCAEAILAGKARRRGGRCQDRRDHGHGSAQR